jgi:formylglycine-generating enzyme required for sulfatase activity
VKFAQEAAASGALGEACEVLDAVRAALAEPKKQAQAAHVTAARAAALARTRSPADRAAREKKAVEAKADVEAIDAALAAVAECAKGLQPARREHESLRAAQERLKTAPDDPDACLAVGRWYCIEQNNWNTGLKLLAKGSEEVWKSLAASELAPKPARPEARIARGDAWWDLAATTDGKAQAVLRRRAALWYKEALPGMTPGLEKSRAEKRVALSGAEPLPQPDGGSVRVRPPLAVAPFDAKTAQQHQLLWAKYLGLPVEMTNSIGMKLVLIPPGEFMMGSPKEAIEEELAAKFKDPKYKGRLPNEGPQHRVRITKPFYLGTCEVTQEEYQRVMGTNPSAFSAAGKLADKVGGQDTKRLPVEQVQWDDAAEFCQKLAEMPDEKAKGRQYRLPSEAQWEYACRAGSTGRYGLSSSGSASPSDSDEHDLFDFEWIISSSGGLTHAVGGKRPTVWGLHDMLGNVAEWCQDWYDQDYYAHSPVDDPTGPATGSERVFRGGGWNQRIRLCRAAYRPSDPPGHRDNHLGLRVALLLPDK